MRFTASAKIRRYLKSRGYLGTDFQTISRMELISDDSPPREHDMLSSRNRLSLQALLLTALLSFSLPSAQAATLFEKIGGEPKLKAGVDELVKIMLDDDRINFVFADTDLNKFKALLYGQLCQLSGGPCTYTGRDMFTAHKKLKVKNAQFNALTEDLYLALDHVGVEYRTQNKLIALLAPMQRDIVK